MKKKKLAVIGIAGVAGMLYSATPASAQTFYQCMPVKCKTGEYASGSSCERCTGGYRCPGDNKRYACTGEWEYAEPGSSYCSTFGPSDIENMGVWVGTKSSTDTNFTSNYVSLKNLRVSNNRYFYFAGGASYNKNTIYAIYFHCNDPKDTYKDGQTLCTNISNVLLTTPSYNITGGGGCFSIKQDNKYSRNLLFVPDITDRDCIKYLEDRPGNGRFIEIPKSSCKK